MKIALVHFRVGETDGVSLEMDKWKRALTNLGHEVIYISGSSELKNVKVINEIAYNDSFDLTIGSECYSKLDIYNCETLQEAIYEQADIIKNKFIDIINSEKIDCLVPNNIFALGKSLPAAIGMFKAIEETNIMIVNHHHDFYWERDKYSNPTCDFINSLLHKYFPPKHSKMRHAVINSAAKEELLKRKNIDSTVVPNVFDFNAPLWIEDDFNKDFKQSFGLNDKDVVFLQATRVTNRKSIELAIRVIAKLNNKKNTLINKTLYDNRLITKDTNFVLLVVGLHEGLNNYEDRLIALAKELNVKMIFDPSKIGHSRSIKNGIKMYSLWDAYIYADIVTYPSIYEGWGNQFLEGLFAKKPMIVYEYSVFEKDIAPKGFKYISLGNKYVTDKRGLALIDDSITEEATVNLLEFLLDKEARENAVNFNFEIGKKYYSIDTLSKILENLFS